MCLLSTLRITTSLLNHLRVVCTSLHEVDAVTIGPAMLNMYNDAESIPQYINMLEEARKRSPRADLPIADDTVFAIASCLDLASGNVPHDCKKWNALNGRRTCGTLGKPGFARPTRPDREQTQSMTITGAPLVA